MVFGATLWELEWNEIFFFGELFLSSWILPFVFLFLFDHPRNWNKLSFKFVITWSQFSLFLVCCFCFIFVSKQYSILEFYIFKGLFEFRYLLFGCLEGSKKLVFTLTNPLLHILN